MWDIHDVFVATTKSSFQLTKQGRGMSEWIDITLWYTIYVCLMKIRHQYISAVQDLVTHSLTATSMYWSEACTLQRQGTRLAPAQLIAEQEPCDEDPRFCFLINKDFIFKRFRTSSLSSTIRGKFYLFHQIVLFSRFCCFLYCFVLTCAPITVRVRGRCSKQRASPWTPLKQLKLLN